MRQLLGSWWAYPLALIAGLALPLTFAPFRLAALAPVALGIAFAVVTAAPGRRAVAASYLFGVAYVGFGAYWVYISISRYGGGPLAAGIVTPLLLLIVALYPLLALWLGRRLGHGRDALTTLAALPLAWVAVEWIRSWLFTGTTWLTVGYSQIDTPLARLAPAAGTYGISLAVALVGGAIGFWLLRPLGWRLLVPVAAIGAVALTALLPVGGGWTRPVGEPLSVALLQGNISQDQKWLDSQRGETMRWYAERTRAYFGTDIVVWPETAVPAFYHQVREDFIEPFADEAAANGTTVLTGIPVVDIAREGFFNAVMRLGDEPEFYYKRHLVPFGEYVPFRDLLGGALDFVGAPLGDFNAGDSADPLAVAGQPVGASVCYEITFGAEIADALPEARMLVNVSNDAWFGDSLAPHQHLQMTRMRALETGRPVLRATNTGITAIIDEAGRITARAPSFRPAVLTGAVQPREGVTPYVRWRDWPVVGLVSAGLLLVFLGGGRAAGTGYRGR